MGDPQSFVQHLFAIPGGSTPDDTLRRGAAGCHRRLLQGVTSRGARSPGDAIGALLSTIEEEGHPELSCAILNHPLLVEALHAMAPEDAELLGWEDATVPVDAAGAATGMPAHGREKLNNVGWAFLLRRCPNWCGEVELCTDDLGFLRFAFSDWSMWLRMSVRGQGRVLTNTVVRVSLGPRWVRWFLAGDPSEPFLIMDRGDCWRLVVSNDPAISAERLAFPHPVVHPRLQFATRLGDSAVRYDPVGFDDAGFAAHAGLTGALVEALLEAIHANAPGIYQELGRYVTAIRGFELSPGREQTLSSFSMPTMPGIMTINVAYSPDDQPLLSPFCFTWVGHELGHTKHYLIDDAAYGQGCRFLHNPRERTDQISRYQRALPVRTVFQIPYVHLYELALMIAFLEGHFSGLPWDVPDDPVAFGDDLVAEIHEAFELIDAWADLTPAGVAAVAHIRGLAEPMVGRWSRERNRAREGVLRRRSFERNR